MLDRDPKLLGHLLSVLVHDLRNPLAALTNNVTYARDARASELPEVLDDLALSTQHLTLGVDHLFTLAQLLSGERVVVNACDVVTAVTSWAAASSARATVDSHEAALDAQGGSIVSRLLDVIVSSGSELGAQTLSVTLRANQERVEVVVLDPRTPVAPELRATFFEVETQLAAKSRGDGRYARSLGWIAARALLDAAQATMVCDDENGKARFTISFARA